MFKTIKDFNDAAYDFLQDVVSGAGVDPVLLETDYQSDTMDVIVYCAKENFVTGVTPWTDGGQCARAHIGNMRITREGLAFMEAHSDKNIKKLKKDVFLANLRSWISLIIAAGSLAIALAAFIMQ